MAKTLENFVFISGSSSYNSCDCPRIKHPSVLSIDYFCVRSEIYAKKKVVIGNFSKQATFRNRNSLYCWCIEQLCSQDIRSFIC